jgi:formate hydrogenlyase subunit 3/multisubunit Na+/H+ antiporter MnhD subunit
MSLIEEIHNQRPVVRHVLFILSVAIAVSAVGFFGFSSIQESVFFATHADEQERQAFLASREAGRPQPLAAISRATSSMFASIGSLIGWNTGAGFDRGGQQADTQGGVHLLPLSQ